MKNLDEVLESVKKGLLTDVYSIDTVTSVNEYVMNVMKLSDWSKEIVEEVRKILTISNIIYNNTTKSALLLDDNIYDRLLERYKEYVSVYPIGAEPIRFDESDIIHKPTTNTNIVPWRIVPNFADMLYYDDMAFTPKTEFSFSQIPPWSIKKNVMNVRNVPHSNNELVGTLDKCKFVLIKDAKDAGLLNDPSVKVFERDFIQKHVNDGLYDMDSEQTLIAELKYDGFGLSATIKDGHIIRANTRGDTANDKAKDLTPVFEGYTFPNALDIKGEFEVQFEAIILTPYLRYMSERLGIDYANARNAVSGICSRLDAYKYRDYITLVPIKTDMIDDETGLHLDRLVEIEFLNRYIAREVPLIFSVFTGDYITNLFQVKKFMEEAYYMRMYQPFMYDGIVISYYGDEIRQKLGRKNFVDQYSMAIKFQPLEVDTIFLGYKYTVGLGGVITPMIYYRPVEFYGSIHDHSSGHSLKRFNNLQLKVGDVIKVTYTNDVMPYVTKPDIDVNRDNPNPVVQFITHCPVCGFPIEISESGNSARCPNVECPGRKHARMVNLISKLDIRDFGPEMMMKIQENLKAESLRDLFNLTQEDVAFLGPNNSYKLIDRINRLKTEPIYDYKIVGALGFTNIAEGKWRIILNEIPLTAIAYEHVLALDDVMADIKGIGKSTRETIMNERKYFFDDLELILSMTNVIPTLHMKFGLKIRFSGIRDKELCEKLNAKGHDAGEGAVTKDTDILIVPMEGHVSAKTKKASQHTLIIPYQEFVSNTMKYLV